MKITVEIAGTEYAFEMNRAVYKKLLADEEYAKMQNEITRRLKEKKGAKNAVEEVGEDMIEENISAAILRNMVMEEQVFFYALTTNHPAITMEDAMALLDLAIAEYGDEEVSTLVMKLLENFTQRVEQPKKKMILKIS